MKKQPLPAGELENIVRSTFARSGITEVVPHTPAALFVTVSKWDGLLNQVELNGLRMLVRQLSPMHIDGFEPE